MDFHLKKGEWGWKWRGEVASTWECGDGGKKACERKERQDTEAIFTD